MFILYIFIYLLMGRMIVDFINDVFELPPAVNILMIFIWPITIPLLIVIGIFSAISIIFFV